MFTAVTESSILGRAGEKGILDINLINIRDFSTDKHNKADDYPFGGGFGDGLSETNYYPVEATLTDWIARNNVSTTATLEQVTPTTSCRHYREPLDNSKPSAEVTLCIVDAQDVYDPATQIVFGGGHSWPGGVRSPSASSDTPPNDFSANDYLWKFFQR